MLVAAEPSPQFVARVRARVAEEPEPGRWRGWMLAVPAAVAVAIAVLIMWPSREQVPMGQEGPALHTSRQAADAVQPVMPLAASPETPRVRTRSAPGRVLAVAAATDRAVDIDFPEVVIAENEVRTFASLVASLRQRRFDAAVPAPPDLDTPIEVKELPPVEPIEIEPIVKLAALQAEGERP